MNKLNIGDINKQTCILTNLTPDDLNLIHSSLSHQVIDISRHMRHNNITCIMHNSLTEQMTELQKVIHKVGIVIESRRMNTILL